MTVEDCITTRQLIKKILEPEGYRVIEAENGAKALDIALSADRPDLITLDIEMPQMDGITLCRKIRTETRFDDLPIIFLTSLADRQKRIKVFQAGATDYIIKPFIKEELLARLQVHLERTRLIRQLRKTIEELSDAESERMEKQKLEGVVEMAGAICHELNQPIQTISGFAELLMLKTEDGDPLSSYAEKIKLQTERMGKVTSRLMHITAYRTKAHDAGTSIIDIEEAAGKCR